MFLNYLHKIDFFSCSPLNTASLCLKNLVFLNIIEICVYDKSQIPD